MNKAYSPINWENDGTPINEDNLNKMDRAIDTIDSRVVDIDRKVSGQQSLRDEVIEAAELAAKSEVNAKESEEKAKQYYENTAAVADVHIATQDRAGLVKGGDNYIAEDGTLTLTRQTTNTTLEHSHNGGIKVIEIGGKTEQKQYSGKNLYSGGDQSFTKSVDVILEKELPPGTYTVSAFVTSNDTDHTYCLVGFMDGAADGNLNTTLNRDIRNSKTVTTVNPVSKIRFNASIGLSDSTGDTATWKDIQIEAGSEMTDYEPFVGNKQSPSPEYPQEMESVVLKGAKSVGEQLLDINDYELGSYSNSDGRPISSSGAYRFNKAVKVDYGETIYLLKGMISYWYSGEEDNLTLVLYDAGSGLVKTVPKDVTYVKFRIFGADFETFDPEDYMVSKSEITEWKPYQEKSIVFSQPITLNGIGDAQDLIVRKDGEIGTNRELKEDVFDGSDDEEWFRVSSTYSIYALVLKDVKMNVFTQNKALCDRYIYDPKTNSNMIDGTFKVGTTTSGERGYIYICDTSFATVEEFVAQLKEKPINVAYPLAEPTFEPLPTADQIALNSLLSFDGVTHLFFDSEIQPTSLVKYGTSEVGALTLEAWNKAENSRIEVEEMKKLQTALATALVVGSEV